MLSQPLPRRTRLGAPVLLAAALGVAYVVVAPPSTDLAAQLLRTKLFGAAPLGLWNNWWYGGQYTPAYSVLFPPLAWLLGPRLLGALAAVGATACFAELTDSPPAAAWLGLGCAAELASGRLTLMLGLALAAAALLASAREHPAIGGGLALLTALASPVAALVLLIGALATRRAALLWSAVPLLLLSFAFPTGGFEPFAWSEFWPVTAASLALALLASGPLRTGLILYAAGCLGAYLIHTPVGGNAAQLGQLALGPIAVLLLSGHGRWVRAALVLACVPLMYLSLKAGVTDLRNGHGNPSTSAAYYRPLIRFLAGRGHDFRVEVPFTSEHWESYELAPYVPLARGWERQADIGLNPLFYGGAPLNRATYLAWLHTLAVRYVAIADVRLDYSARAEVRLARRLRRVATVGHWQVYAVPNPTPIVSGARLVHFGPDSLTMDFARPGSAVVRVRWSSLWRLAGAPGSVSDHDGFCEVHARRFGRVTMTVSL